MSNKELIMKDAMDILGNSKIEVTEFIKFGIEDTAKATGNDSKLMAYKLIDFIKRDFDLF